MPHPMKALTPYVLALVATSSLVACGRTASQPQPVPSTAEPARQAGHFEVAEVVYDGKLGKGWDDWGWGPHELAAGQPARIGFASFGGIILHHDELPSRFGGLSFRFLAPATYGDFLEVSLQYRQVDESTLPLVKIDDSHIATLPDGWREVLIPWAALNPQGSPFDRIQIHARKPVAADPVSIDKVLLTKPLPGAPVAAGNTGPARRVNLQVDCSLPITRINPLIYGMAGDPWPMSSPARRMGGNPMTRFNWDLGMWNVGADWFFQNVRASADGSKVADWIQKDVDHGVKTALTVPLIGWVSKDDSSFGFPISKLGAQRARDQHRNDSGDGYAADGKPIKPGPPSETSVAAPPELIGKWIANLREADKARGKRGVDMYILDNEPNLWNTTHRDVHPDPLSYDELLDRTIKYGTVIRKADPEALIAGPAEWGWTGYFSSAKDIAGAIKQADRAAHGGVPLIPWYLRKLAQHEKQTGTRLLDILDVHYYPQAKGVWGGNSATDRESNALRLRSTRALWDPTYRDESWIDEDVRLIPRLKDWVAQNYPGRGIQIGEWNFGAEEHINGGLAVAEVLGRFGQQGITSAFYWFAPPEKSPAAEAFRIYRNYDGKGARFLDWSMPAESPSKVSFFVSRDEPGKRVTAVILNLDPDEAIDAYVDIGRCGTVGTRRSFGYREGDSGIGERKVDNKNAPERLPPYSMAVIEYALAK